MKSIIKRMFSFLLVAITIFNSTAMGSYAAEKQNAVKLKESLGIGRQHTFAIDEYGNMYEIVGNNVFFYLGE